ncbi:MBL fold metallo-hydrolase [Nocardioidaceae bacterium]|nr:MBL fold metallo-hydrolase [Nocardioidaceae bacterium]
MTTRVHHLDCARMRPLGAVHPKVAPAVLVSHVMVVESSDRLTLVDTGFGRGDAERPERLGATGRTLRAELSYERTAHAQLGELGLSPGDVTDIVLTHLDLDHAGGIKDFPNAVVHLHEHELQAARGRPSLKEQQRYVPPQWTPAPQWRTYKPVEGGGDGWMGFDSVEIISDVVLVPLSGHTRGHCGVAVRRPDDAGWFLHAGDAIFDASEAGSSSSCPWGLRAYQHLIKMDGTAWAQNRERLRELRAGHDDIEIVASHDTAQFERLAGVSVT